jgi:hypothetical protein
MAKVKQMCDWSKQDDAQRPRFISDKAWDEQYGSIDWQDGPKLAEMRRSEIAIVRVDTETGEETRCGKEGPFEDLEGAEARAAFMNQSWLLNKGCTYKAVTLAKTPA